MHHSGESTLRYALREIDCWGINKSSRQYVRGRAFAHRIEPNASPSGGDRAHWDSKQQALLSSKKGGRPHSCHSAHWVLARKPFRLEQSKQPCMPPKLEPPSRLAASTILKQNGTTEPIKNTRNVPAHRRRHWQPVERR